MEEAVICPKCGCAIEETVKADAKSSSLTAMARIWMIIGTVATCLSLYFIPIVWCLPMTIYYFNKTKKGEKVSTGFKVCALLFVSLPGGVIMLCDK